MHQPKSNPDLSPDVLASQNGEHQGRGGVATMPATVPRCLARSPAALKGYLRFNEALSAGDLSASTRVLISLLVSEIHGCAYCTEIYLAAGRAIGVPPDHMVMARAAKAADARMQSVLSLVERVVIQRSDVGIGDLETARRAGLGDAEIAEIVANVALTVFANYFSRMKILGLAGCEAAADGTPAAR